MGQNFQKLGKISQHFWSSPVLTISFPGEKFQYHEHPSFSPTPLLMIQTHMQISVCENYSSTHQHSPNQPIATLFLMGGNSPLIEHSL
jgi:hypothetical protein